jgi:hypothetical protein
MNAKEKAVELVYKHLPFVAIDNKWDSEYLQKKDNAKKSALITINQMIEAVYDLDDDSVDYYREVKYEIENL